MSTRSNIVIRKGNEKKYMYHHWDGYPAGVGNELYLLLFLEEDTVGGRYYSRDYKHFWKLETLEECAKFLNDYDGSYEYTNMIHGDIEYLYLIDIDKKSFSCYKVWSLDLRGENAFEKIVGRQNLKQFRYVYNEEKYKKFRDLRYSLPRMYNFNYLFTGFEKAEALVGNSWTDLKKFKQTEGKEFMEEAFKHIKENLEKLEKEYNKIFNE